MKRLTGLLSVVAFASACEGAGVPADVTTVATMNSVKYVVNNLKVPQMRTDYAIDLNGDGKVDNQLGNIIGALTAQNLNTQDALDMSLAEGSVIVLVEALADSGHVNSQIATAKMSIGKSMMNPVFTGQGTFMVDSTIPTAIFKGRTTNSKFSSNNPATTTDPVNIAIGIPLVAGSPPVQLKVAGAHVTFRTVGDGLMSGELHGAICGKDVQAQIIPNVAQLLNDRVKADPNSSTNKQILQIFDQGCDDATAKNFDGSAVARMDGKVATCEVATNAIIKNVLNPDVQMYADANCTTYDPNPENKTKDSLSLGLSFTGVKATF